MKSGNLIFINYSSWKKNCPAKLKDMDEYLEIKIQSIRKN